MIPADWRLTILPLPKGQSFADASGLCGGSAVGRSERGGRQPVAHWWPGGQPAAITLDRQEPLSVCGARGDGIAGYWSHKKGGFGGAVGFRREGTTLVARDLPPPAGFSWTIAMGVGGGAFAGYGQPAAKGARERALFWDAGGSLVELQAATADAQARARALDTDGTWVVGYTGFVSRQQAALWSVDGAPVKVLGDDEAITEASSVGDGEQVGVRSTPRGGCAAALWRGTPGSFVDLTPRGFEYAWAHGCAAGFQVGLVKKKDETTSGASSMANRAALWAGSAASFVDLHATVPAPWNASTAGAVERDGNVLRVAGSVTQFGTENEMTPRESQFLITRRAAVWEATLA